ncbi:MAG: RNA polymerase sigma-70 factor (ECF subfamily) [Parasphingorhabdus sp.]|jgi:RNA polymerase sigma-70 factor (ECF subfamily)
MVTRVESILMLLDIFVPGLSERGLRQWQQQHWSRLKSLAWSWCGDADLAEDLVQECFTRALKHRRQLKDTEQLKPWLLKILHNVYLDYLKSAQRREIPASEFKLADTFASDTSDPVVQYEQSQRAVQLRRAVAALPEPQRKVITLVDLQELTYRQCAEVLDVPTGTVMSRLSRARQTLHEYLSARPTGRSTLRRIK